MLVSKVKRVTNPFTRKKRRNSGVKRKLSPKQIKFFGSSRQRAALKASRSRKRNGATKKRSTAAKHRRRSNPAQLITLGFANPQRKGKKNMAAKTKRRRRATAKNPTTRRRRRRVVNAAPRRRRTHAVKHHRRRRVAVASNPRRRRRVRRNGTRIVVMSPKRRNSRGRRRNPDLFGRSVGFAEMGKAVVAGLVGVTATKAIPKMLPAQFTSTPLYTFGTSLAVALGCGFLTRRFMPDVASAVTFGGLMQAFSVGLNAFLPSVGSTIGLSGLGDLIGPARFAVPQNPMYPAFAPAPIALPPGHPAAMAAAMGAGAGAGMSGAFRPAF